MERESQLVEKIARALSSGTTAPSQTPSSPKLSSRQRPPSGRRGISLRSFHHLGSVDSSSLRLGIGDDAAILAPSARSEWVLTCDAFLEGVHFLAKTHPPDSVGYKSLARATSDLAAMGATPRYFLLTLALPPQFTRAAISRRGAALQSTKKSSSAERSGLIQGLVGRGFSHDIKSATSRGALAPEAPSEAWLNSFLKGMARAARELGITIIGGDTTKSDRLFISITALGEIPRGRALTRSGAKPGDLIFVSGKLGRAQLGLELVLRGLASDRRFRALTQPHLYPKIRVALGEWLAQRRIASSAMDLSDGLSTDLARLCAASDTGAKIYPDKIPSVKIPAAAQKLGQRKLDPLQLALHGGEDYELLFTVPPHQAKKLRNAPGASALTAIGKITRKKNIILIHHDGSHEPLEPAGWDPFHNS
ncbi:MAG: thiamine-phosphate kinase [Candidatus Acidiferrales bacterium]